MPLPKQLLRQFAELTNDKPQPTRTEYYYGVAKLVDGAFFVELDGANGILTPASSTVDIKDGDRVMCLWKDRTLTITGNVTNNAVTFESLTDPNSKTVIDGGLIKTGRIESMNGQFYVDLETGRCVLLNGQFGGMMMASERIDVINFPNWNGDWETHSGLRTGGFIVPHNIEVIHFDYIRNNTDQEVVVVANGETRTIPPKFYAEDWNIIINEATGTMSVYCLDYQGRKFDCYEQYPGNSNYVQADGFVEGSVQGYIYANKIVGPLFAENVYYTKPWDDDTGDAITLSSGWTSGAANANGNIIEAKRLRMRKLGQEVSIVGAVTADAGTTISSGTIIAKVGKKFYAPDFVLYRLTPCSGNAFAKVGMKPNGEIFVDWIMRYNTTSGTYEKVTTCPTWILLDFRYDVDNFDYEE